jgi:hypothetical protein
MCLRSAWILVRLRGSAGWSESMLAANTLGWFCRDAAQMDSMYTDAVVVHKKQQGRITRFNSISELALPLTLFKYFSTLTFFVNVQSYRTILYYKNLTVVTFCRVQLKYTFFTIDLKIVTHLNNTDVNIYHFLSKCYYVYQIYSWLQLTFITC